eukprot:s171_g43.t1
MCSSARRRHVFEPPSSIAAIAMADNPVWKACKPFATGSLAGMFATCCIQPIDMVKVRIQLTAGTAEAAGPLLVAYFTLGVREGRAGSGEGGKEEKRPMVEREERPRLALRSALSLPGMPVWDFTLKRRANVCEGGQMMEIIKEKSGELNVLRRERDAQEEIKDILRVEMEVDRWRKRRRRKEKGNCLEWSLEFSCIVRAIDCKWEGANRAKEVKKNALEIDTPAGGVGWRNVVLVRAGAVSVNVERWKEWIRGRGELKCLEGERLILEFGWDLRKVPFRGWGGWSGPGKEWKLEQSGLEKVAVVPWEMNVGQGEYGAKEGAVLVATEHMIKDGIGIQRGMSRKEEGQRKFRGR